MTKTTARKIRKAAEEMTMQDLHDFLQVLASKGKIAMDEGYYRYKYAIDFAQEMVDRIQSCLDNGEWFGFEPKALVALNNIPCGEHDFVWVDNYGYPREITDNDHFLWITGVENQLRLVEDVDVGSALPCMT